MPRAEIKARVEETARLLRIDHILDRSVSGLAGGDRQRVALGRAIVRRPKVFLMDEPLGTLDTEFRDLMVRELRELHNRIGATTVYVTHDQLEAMAMADKIAVMNRGVDRAVRHAAGDLRSPGVDVRRRFHRLAADELPARACEPAKGAQTLRVNGATIAVPEVREDLAETELALGVRPEHIRFDDASPLRGSVFGAEYLGTTQIVTVTTEHGQLEGAASGQRATSPTARRSASTFRGERLSLFEKASGRAIATARSRQGGAHG